ncbi:MAG: cupin domain-containing protein [Longimicrobiales bacterium]
MIALSPTGPAPRDDRPATMLLHDEPNARIVSFHLLPGQEVLPHKSESTVLVQVIEGSGTFIGESGSVRLETGGSAVYAPGEVHSMTASDGERLRFLAVIMPRPV